MREHPQLSVDRLRNTTRPVEYRHFSMDLDGQVEIEIIALATDEDVQALLSGFDISPVVENLPQIPAGYDPGTGMIVPEQPTRPEE